MIRPAQKDDLPALRRVYTAARQYMIASGNPDQWADGYPRQGVLENDLKLGNRLYVIEEGGQIHGVFAFILGEDPTYSSIEGQWLNGLPYGTIHRIAGDGQIHGIFETALAFCKAICPNIRIDTYKDNATMQHLILKHGFTRCGIIYLENGSPRIAYQALFR